MSIEECNRLIEEIETTNKEYEKEVERRKQKRIIKKRRHKRNILLAELLPITLVLSMYINQFIDNKKRNIYKENTLKISSERKENIKEIIEVFLNITVPDKKIDSYFLLNAIIQNNNLTVEDKKTIATELLKLIKDNPYIDKERAYYSLLNFDINYTKRPFYEEDNIIGKYIYQLPVYYYYNQIFIYENVDKVKEHELIHCLLINNENQFIPSFLSEGLTELLCNEYFEKNPYIELIYYPFQINTVKILIEILSEDLVLQSYCKGDLNLIYDKLTEINPKYNAENIIKELNEIMYQELSGEKIDPLKIDILHKQLEEYYTLSKNPSKEESTLFEYYLSLFDCLKESKPYSAYLAKLNPNMKKSYYNKVETTKSRRLKK